MIDELMSKHRMIKDVQVKQEVNNPIYKHFKNNPAYRDVFSITQNKRMGVHILDEGNTANIPKRYIIPYKNEVVNCGELVRFNEDSTYWLCTAVNNSLGYTKGFFSESNTTLRWIDENGKLQDKPALISAKTLYTTGIKDEGTILVPNGMLGILLALDSDSKKIGRNDAFIFNNTRYLVTFFDTTSVENVVSLICEERGLDTFKDDKENRIANRYDDKGNDLLVDDTVIEPEPPTNSEEIKITGNDDLYFGETATYKVEGTDIAIEQARIAPGGFAEIISVNGQEITVKANNSYNMGVCDMYVTLDGGEELHREIRITW